jgi:uncharacterized protein (TIGR02598 family)
MRPAFTISRRPGGFSLVEVAISLGIVAFALTGIVGLLSATLKTSKSSMDDLLVSEMTSDIVNTLRKQDFANISSNPTSVFFDVSGKRINGVDTNTGVISNVATEAAVAQGAVYVCNPTVQADPDTIGNSRTNLWRVSLKFQWPATSTNNPKTIHADIARY